MAAAGRSPTVPADGALADPATTGLVALVAALVVTLSGIVLGNLPSLDAMRVDHGLVPSAVDEVARSGVLVFAAIAALAGRLRWRRWAALTAALHAVDVAATWAVDAGPVGMSDAVLWRGVAAVGLAGSLVRSARPTWLGAGRSVGLAALALLAGAGALGGLRGTVAFGGVGPAVLDGVRTSAGLATTVVALLTALVVLWADDRRLGGLHAATAGVLALAAVAGDTARWLGESRRGPAGVLALRGAVALAALVVGAVVAVRRRGVARPSAGSA